MEEQEEEWDLVLPMIPSPSTLTPGAGEGEAGFELQKEMPNCLPCYLGRKRDIDIDALVLICHLDHLGPAQLSPSATSAQPNLHELASRGHHMA
jgi:hypothetical protein